MVYNAADLTEETGKVCAQCLKPIFRKPLVNGSGASGWAEDRATGATYCPTCNHAREIEELHRTGKGIAYLASTETSNAGRETGTFKKGPMRGITMTRTMWRLGPYYTLTDWFGIPFATASLHSTYYSNMRDERFAFTFVLDGERWHGIGYGGPGMHARIYRNKRQDKAS